MVYSGSIFWRFLCFYVGILFFKLSLGKQSLTQVYRYLSLYPEGLREAFTTGGIPPINQSPDQVYKATYAKVIERNKVS